MLNGHQIMFWILNSDTHAKHLDKVLFLLIRLKLSNNLLHWHVAKTFSPTSHF